MQKIVLEWHYLQQILLKFIEQLWFLNKELLKLD